MKSPDTQSVMHAWFRAARLMAAAALACVSAQAQPPVLSGIVQDSRTHGAVDAAVITLVEARMRTATDTSGRFHFALPSRTPFTLSVRRLGYSTVDRTIDPDTSASPIVIALVPSPLESGEVVIRSTPMRGVSQGSAFPTSVLMPDDRAASPPIGAADALAGLPGISLVRDGAWETAVSIRGMSRSNIVMMVDRVRIETANDIAGVLSLIDVQEIERIEAVRSPGSSLWGSSALGGVIHMMTRQPAFSDAPQLHLQIDEQASSVNGLTAHHVSVDRSLPGVGVHAAAGYRHAGDLRTPDGRLADSRFTDFHLTARVAVRTFGQQTLHASYQRSQAEDAGIPGGAPIALQASARYTLARRELASLEYMLPELSPAFELLTLRVARQEITRNVEIRQSPVLTLTPHAVHAMTSAQAESRCRLAPDLTLTSGIDVWKRSLDSRRERVNTALAETIGERPIPLSSCLNAGIFLHTAWTILPGRLTLDAGARHDWIRVENEAAMKAEYTIGGPIRDGIPPTQVQLWKAQTAQNRSWSASAGVTLALSSGMDCSLLASASFRAPSLEERFQYLDLGSVVRLGDPLLKPEQSRALDLGIALQREGARVRIDAFLNALTDLVTEVPGIVDHRPAFIKTNVGEALLYGFDVSASSPLSERVTLHALCAYVHGEDTRAHLPLPQIAPLNGSLSLDASIPSIGTVSIDAACAARQTRAAAGETPPPAFIVAGIAYASEPVDLALGAGEAMRCRVRLGVENLFNASYRLHLSTLRGMVTSEPGRNFSLALSLFL